MRAPSKLERRPDIQGLRAVAVMLVVAFHAGLPLPGGFVGVDVFFVISGFVIARLLLHELAGSGSVDLARFYTRRVRRLLPALSLLIVFVALTSTVLLSPVGPQQSTSSTGIGASLFGANVQLFRSPSGYFDLGADANALLHTWSLSVEEQFYFLFPSYLLLAWRLGARRQASRAACVIAIAAAILASFALSFATSHGHGDRVAHALGGGIAKFAFYLPFGRIWEFGVGILVALCAERLGRMPRGVADLVGLGGIGAVVAGALLITGSDPFPGSVALLPVLGTAAAIAAGCHERSRVSSVLGIRPLVVIGDVSYGWYLWHWPAIVIARAWWPSFELGPIIAATVALIPTALSYRFIEQRYRLDDKIVRGRAVALVAICIAVSLAACFALRFINRVERERPAVLAIEEAVELHADTTRGCSDGPALGLPRCTWNKDAARGTIVLVGDSNAGQLTEAVADAATAAGYRFVVATRNGCPFADIDAVRSRHDPAGCRRFVRDTIERIESMRPSLVVVASASSYYMIDGDTELRDGGVVASTPEAKATMWETATRSLAKRFANAGIPLAVIHNVPRMPGFGLMTCPFLRIEGDTGACAARVDRARTEAAQRLAREAEQRAVAGIPLATAKGLFDELCDAQACTSFHDGMWWYRDEGHISVPASKKLAVTFSAVIGAHARDQPSATGTPSSASER